MVPHQPFQVGEVRRLLRQAEDDTLYMHTFEKFHTLHLASKAVVRIHDDTQQSSLPGLCLYPLYEMGIGAERHIGHHNTNGAGGVEAKTDGKGVRTVALLVSQLLNPLSEG